jgi:endonuclease/exonuclease/phosphatase family metal-dependent hydrolase
MLSKPTHRDLDWYRYADGWQTVADAPTTTTLNCIAISSQNAWFSSHERITRANAFLAYLEDKGWPDIVCLQEMTASALRELLRSQQIRNNYCTSTTVDMFEELAASHGYDSVIFVRPWLAQESIQRWDLTSVYGRKFFVFGATINGQRFGFGTVHLESTDLKKDARAQQLKEIYAILEDQFPGGSIMCGDWNHCESRGGEHHFDDAVTDDIWPKLHPEDFGATKNPNINLMLARSDPKIVTGLRLDRIGVNGAARQFFTPTSIELVGVAPIPADKLMQGDAHTPAFGPDVWISDHFGLYATFGII